MNDKDYGALRQTEGEAVIRELFPLAPTNELERLTLAYAQNVLFTNLVTARLEVRELAKRVWNHPDSY